MKSVIGYVIGESDTLQATLLLKQSLRVGEYIVLEYLGKKVLGLITSVIVGSPLFDEKTNDIKTIEQIKNMDKVPVYMKAKVKLLLDLNRQSVPDQPPLPLTVARMAEEDELRTFASNGDIEIGTLIGTNVEVRIDANALFRHLAILAATGAGKSNTVAILSSRIADLGGTVLIFDYHGEYVNSDMKKMKPIAPIINPLHLTVDEFAKLAYINERKAHIQFRLLRKTFNEIKNNVREKKISKTDLTPDTFIEVFEKKLEDIADKEHGDYKKRVDEVKDKVEDFIDRYRQMISFAFDDITQQIVKGAINVVDMTEIGDDTATDAIMSHYLRRILQSRKDYKNKGRGLEFPIIVTIEEAHVFLSGKTLTKEWASKIAREGRKFGVGLIIVSQRPRGIDENILSQMTNKIILRIVEPTDQKYVLEASDNLSQDLVNSLPSLDVGEALIVGNLTRIPLMVKIDKFEGKLGGGTPKFFTKPENGESWEI